MPEIDFQRLEASPAVTVTIPARVAFDINALFEVQKTIFDRMGHGGCYSGADIRFVQEREFVVGLDGKVRGVPG